MESCHHHLAESGIAWQAALQRRAGLSAASDVGQNHTAKPAGMVISSVALDNPAALFAARLPKTVSKTAFRRHKLLTNLSLTWRNTVPNGPIEIGHSGGPIIAELRHIPSARGNTPFKYAQQSSQSRNPGRTWPLTSLPLPRRLRRKPAASTPSSRCSSSPRSSCTASSMCTVQKSTQKPSSVRPRKLDS